VVNVDPAASGTLENSATAGSDAIDPNSANNQPSVLTAVTAEADLSLSKSANAAVAVAGGQLTYTLTITNGGPSLATGVRVTDTLPVSTSFSSATPSIGSCGESGGEVVCDLGGQAADAVAHIIVVVNVDLNASGTLENSATAGSSTFDGNGANDNALVTTPVTTLADLRLSKTANALTAVAGGQLTYTLTITNDGPSVATAVRVTDTLPLSTSFASATPSTGSCGESGGATWPSMAKPRSPWW